MTAERRPNYWDYIRVEDLLGLQGGIERDESRLANDEVMFITVHQIFELWFKLILRELVSTRDLFKAELVEEQVLSQAARSVRRVITVLRRAIDHFEVMETLTTRDYLAFRDKLTPASGFQSAQLRQIEILMGLEEGARIPLGPAGSYLDALRSHDGSESPALRRVLRQLEDRPSLREAVEQWLYRTPIDGVDPKAPDAEEKLDAFVEEYLEAHAREVDRSYRLAIARTSESDGEAERLRAMFDSEKDSVRAFFASDGTESGRFRRRVRTAIVFISSYRELPLLAWPREILDGLLEMEQAFLIFRQRHARMVERVIGKRIGTGGSAGVDYLDRTALAYRVFEDLWAIRTLQIRKEACPRLRDPDFYAFRNG